MMPAPPKLWPGWPKAEVEPVSEPVPVPVADPVVLPLPVWVPEAVFVPLALLLLAALGSVEAVEPEVLLPLPEVSEGQPAVGFDEPKLLPELPKDDPDEEPKLLPELP
jgi:hypothetical protein